MIHNISKMKKVSKTGSLPVGVVMKKVLSHIKGFTKSNPFRNESNLDLDLDLNQNENR